MGRGIIQNDIIDGSAQSHLTRSHKLHRGLSTQNTLHDRIIKIVICQKSRLHYFTFAPCAFKARNRKTTGAGLASSLAFHSFQSDS